MATRSWFMFNSNCSLSQSVQCRTMSSSSNLWHTNSAKLIREHAREKLKLIDQDSKVDHPKVSPNLIDTFGRKHTYLRISLTERCNLRCQYCMPENGIPKSQLTPTSKLMTTPELLNITEILVRHGINKIRFTGGEPSLRSDLPDIIHKVNQLNGIKSIGMTSNGILLKRRLKSLIDAGLTNLNLSLDTLDPFKFELLTRRKGHHVVLDCLDQALNYLKPHPTNLAVSDASSVSALDSVKLNVVVIRGLNDDEINDFVSLTEKKAVQIRFIEYMPFEGNAWSNKKMVPYSEMLASIKSIFPDLLTLETDVNDTTKHYQVPGFKGQIGFISSMSDHFCGGCNRLRLGADGKLKVCLFGPPKLSILPYLRDPDHPRHVVDKAYKPYFSRYSGRIRSQIKYTTGHQSSGLGLLPKSHISSISGSSTSLTSRIPVYRQYHSPPNILTHIDSTTGKPKMVDVSSKEITKRSSKAIGFVVVPIRIRSLVDPNFESNNQTETNNHHNLNSNPKGNPLMVAQIAGIQAIKKTSELIPLCHNSIPLSHIEINIEIIEPKETDQEMKLKVECNVKCEGKTGVEMESLMGVSITCLTLWDMLKASCGKEMWIEKVRVVEKKGGKHDFCL
ncbi:uncharacterized protein MELLADRAFT_114913 [Melampsora larici-populina 98AG31]|uniref:GTP 3',8-cyclase n=1 Tax=Melampsora larici-populina (strain 98AG31 / pathotype 3-4-7) TaxID=747676 RepID=F4R4B6_MELLP|nr:uncharacterized protein MELLADRAFT_114913 [Melampsora larici-populina 98AG31]EGG13030.1 hypothetical protein MELLADRAFT_114913 [Melampsora larici-populina 98AG31]